MARSPEGAALTSAHQRRQMVLRRSTLADLAQIWPVWTPGDDRSFERFSIATTTLVRARHRDSAGLASRYYQAFRVAENVGGQATPVLAEPIAAGQVLGAIGATGRAGVLRGLRAGRSLEEARRLGFVSLAGSMARLVLNGGRETILGSVRADKRAVGWARVASGNPCAFCMMLASQGPTFSEGTADFQAHDHCACGAEPHYEGADWPGRSREFREKWDAATRGHSGTDALNAFRRALAQEALT